MAAKKKTTKEKAVAAKAGQRAAQAKAEQGIPPYLAILLVVMALAFGFMLRVVTQPVPQGLEIVPGFGTGQPQGGQEPQSQGPLRPVDVILLFSSQCGICLPDHTMLGFFDEKGVKYGLEKVDAESERGKALAREYNVKEVPTLLVKADDIRQQKELGDNFQRFFKLQGDRFVVLEPDLDKIMRPKYFLEAPDESCLIEKKPRVFVFDDPYCPSCLVNRLNLKDAREKFGNDVEFIYSYIPTDSKKLIDQYGADKTELAAKYLACAQLQGKISALDQQLLNNLCDLTKDDTATNFEILACQTSKRLAQPIAKEELDKLAGKAGLDMNALAGCADTAQSEFNKAFSRSLAYNVRTTPVAVVDCKYVVHVADLRKGLCSILPEHEACKAKPENG